MECLINEIIRELIIIVCMIPVMVIMIFIFSLFFGLKEKIINKTCDHESITDDNYKTVYCRKCLSKLK